MTDLELKSIENQFAQSLVEKYREPGVAKLLDKELEQLSKSTLGGASYVQMIQIWLDTLQKGERVKLDMFLIKNLPKIRIPHLMAVLGNLQTLQEYIETYKTGYITYKSDNISIFNTIDNNWHHNYDDFVVPVELSKIIDWGLYDNLEVVSTFFCSKENKYYQYDYNDILTDELAREIAKDIIEKNNIDIVYSNIIATPFESFEKEELFTIPYLIDNLKIAEYNKTKGEIYYIDFKSEDPLDLLDFILKQTNLYDR